MASPLQQPSGTGQTCPGIVQAAWMSGNSGQSVPVLDDAATDDASDEDAADDEVVEPPAPSSWCPSTTPLPPHEASASEPRSKGGKREMRMDPLLSWLVEHAHRRAARATGARID
jgi:hypothetical protein